MELVAQQLKDIRKLSGGFDAIGFSQGSYLYQKWNMKAAFLLLMTTTTTPRSGGQFLRAYIERHNDPPIRNLITFGSQHMGISDLPACKPYDLLCNLARNAVRAGVYNEWAQQNLVQVTHTSFPVPAVTHTSPDC